MSKKPESKFSNRPRFAGAVDRTCPTCGRLYIGEPELHTNETSGVRWYTYTHPDKLCKRFLGPKEKTPNA